MNILLLIIFGALVGWITSVILGTRDSQGILGDIILGILGAIAGGYIMNIFGQPGVTGFNLYSIIVGIIGAVVVVAVKRAIVSMMQPR
jgi:uncharacterized membrane protein YeaQ/YmgE (transglycosylase-associated protein family)